MTYITAKLAEEVLSDNPEWQFSEFLSWAKDMQPNWKKNEPRFMQSTYDKYTAAQAVLSKQETEAPVIGGVIESPETRRERTNARTLVFTSAQSNTKLHEGFYNSLMEYCRFNDAELHVSRFTYNKSNHGKKSVKPGSRKVEDSDDLWFDPRLEPYFSDEAMEITPTLVWCGELNILPTRVNPISGFQNYTRRASCIIPHAKMFMESVPTMKHDEPKFVYTTGAVTQRNYIQKAAGQKADFHHVFGAIVVEVAEDGTWWARQINADKNGEFYDLTTKYTPDGVSEEKHRVQAITHGDIHGWKLDQGVKATVFGPAGVLDHLMPHEQFFHDTVDFMARNHHNIKDPHFWHKMYCDGTNVVENEFIRMGWFLACEAYRDWCKSFVVVSNHDQAILHWLRNTTVPYDPANALLWHSLNLYVLREHERGREPHPFKHLLTRTFKSAAQGTRRPAPEFLLEDDSYLILDQIEAAVHGHLGPNGARGTPRNIRGAGKVNSGHTHSAGIFEGVYTAGVYGKLDMGYNRGLSSWSHSMVVTYPNAKRAILTIKNGKAWRDQ